MRHHQEQPPLVKFLNHNQSTATVQNVLISQISADFGELNPPAVLSFTNTQSRDCANIQIVDDNIIETLESFNVILSSDNFQVNIINNIAPVFITDNDGKIIANTMLILNIMTLCFAYSGSL